ncbi:MAG: potassium transporter Kup [Gemmatimonadales bacterium]|nr:potassium transporter Kup [Gemmatimonadales bacterium]
MSDPQAGPAPISAPAPAPPPPAPPAEGDASHGVGHGSSLAGLSLAALGVVYGDIGTSPLYAIKECFSGEHGLPVTPEHVLGVLSLIFWSLNLVVSVKYISYVMRADNRGEGGILALLAQVRHGPTAARTTRDRIPLIMLGLFGAALLYGDGVITPAISVLSAVEGLKVVTPAAEAAVVPLTVGILLLLFLVQRRGTSGIGMVFGPVMALWFVAIAALGVYRVMDAPGVIAALNPLHGLRLLAEGGFHGFLILGAVVLVVTGGEALYADMGHFGRRPIRIAWFGLVLPALFLNYLGQGALLLTDPSVASNPFYAMAPAPLLIPLVVLGTMAAVIASQALISGAFSLTQQAIQLGYSPRVTIVHTSKTEIGQIYIPEVNAALLVSCIGLVLGFRSSTALAAAYGIAVTGTMAITTILFHRMALERWRWAPWKAAVVSGTMLVIDLAFLGANLVKVEQGGWFPLVVGAFVFTLLVTWKQGRVALQRAMSEGAMPLAEFVETLGPQACVRVPGVAVFLSSDPRNVPPVLLHHLKHNKVLHQRVVLLSVLSEEVPYVAADERLDVETLPNDFVRVRAHFGFMEVPDVPATLTGLAAHGLTLPPMQTTYYLGRETLLPGGNAKMARWRKQLFILMQRNAQSAASFFSLPPNRVVEMGAQIQL